MTNKGYHSLSGYYRYRTVLNPKITKDDYVYIRDYANSCGVSLSDFRDYTGDINEIIEIIDKIVLVARDYPRIVEGRSRVVLTLRFSDNEDFAGTDNHTVFLNGYFYDDSKSLQQTYASLVADRMYVNGTTYKDIIFHELGHVICNVYKLDPLDIFKRITNLNSTTSLTQFAINNLSFYSAMQYSSVEGKSCFDASEVIAECFCAYYGKTNNEFATKYVNECKAITEKEELL